MGNPNRTTLRFQVGDPPEGATEAPEVEFVVKITPTPEVQSLLKRLRERTDSGVAPDPVFDVSMLHDLAELAARALVVPEVPFADRPEKTAAERALGGFLDYGLMPVQVVALGTHAWGLHHGALSGLGGVYQQAGFFARRRAPSTAPPSASASDSATPIGSGTSTTTPALPSSPTS